MKVNMFSSKSKFGQYNIKYYRLQGKLYRFNYRNPTVFVCVVMTSVCSMGTTSSPMDKSVKANVNFTVTGSSKLLKNLQSIV